MINWKTTKEQRKNARRLADLEDKGDDVTPTEAAEASHLLMLELDLTEAKIKYIVAKMERFDTVGRSKLMKALEFNADELAAFKERNG